MTPKRNAVVFGATGFIGRSIADELTGQGWTVRSGGRNELDTSRPETISVPSTTEPASFARDVVEQLHFTDLAALSKCMEFAEVVVNAAGAATPLATMSPDITWALSLIHI